MPRDLFGTITNPPARIGSRSRLTLPLSLAAHAVALAALIVVPLVATDALPWPSEIITVTFDSGILPPDPPRPMPPSPQRQVDVPDPSRAPLEAPEGVTTEPVRPPTDVGLESPDSTVTNAVIGAGNSGIAGITPPPPPPPVVARPPVRVGGSITAPTKVHDVAPVYPRMAIEARIQGVVIIQATIGVDGRVVDADVLRPVPFLDQPALEAVRQWRYTPTQLIGEPVAVIMTVTVSFKLL